MISCDAQSGEKSDQLKTKSDGLKSTKTYCNWNDEVQNIRFRLVHCFSGAQEQPQEGRVRPLTKNNDFAHHSSTLLIPSPQRVVVFIMKEAGVGQHVEVMI